MVQGPGGPDYWIHAENASVSPPSQGGVGMVEVHRITGIYKGGPWRSGVTMASRGCNLKVAYHGIVFYTGERGVTFYYNDGQISGTGSG